MNRLPPFVGFVKVGSELRGTGGAGGPEGPLSRRRDNGASADLLAPLSEELIADAEAATTVDHADIRGLVAA